MYTCMSFVIIYTCVHTHYTHTNTHNTSTQSLPAGGILVTPVFPVFPAPGVPEVVAEEDDALVEAGLIIWRARLELAGVASELGLVYAELDVVSSSDEESDVVVLEELAWGAWECAGPVICTP